MINYDKLSANASRLIAVGFCQFMARSVNVVGDREWSQGLVTLVVWKLLVVVRCGELFVDIGNADDR